MRDTVKNGERERDREREREWETRERDNRKEEERRKKVADYFSILSHARMAILPLLQLLLFRDPFVLGQTNS